MGGVATGLRGVLGFVFVFHFNIYLWISMKTLGIEVEGSGVVRGRDSTEGIY